MDFDRRDTKDMPSKEELERINNNNGDNDSMLPENPNLLGVAADMEELVAAIKHNLRLKSKSCHSSLCTKAKRVSPYDVPSRTSCKQHDDFCACAFKSNRHHQKTVRQIDDPYEMLQVLLREGSLIKEAVKRLQLEGGGSTGQMMSKKKATIDFYEHDCSICDLPTTMSTEAL